MSSAASQLNTAALVNRELGFRAVLCEVVLIGSFVPDDFLVVLERNGGQVSRDGRLLAYRRRRDRLFLPLNRIEEVLEVINGAVAFVKIGPPVEMDGLTGSHIRRRFAAERFRGEVEILAV